MPQNRPDISVFFRLSFQFPGVKEEINQSRQVWNDGKKENVSVIIKPDNKNRCQNYRYR
jgi:hypothetical protein